MISFILSSFGAFCASLHTSCFSDLLELTKTMALVIQPLHLMNSMSCFCTCLFQNLESNVVNKFQKRYRLKFAKTAHEKRNESASLIASLLKVEDVCHYKNIRKWTKKRNKAFSSSSSSPDEEVVGDKYVIFDNYYILMIFLHISTL